MRKPIEKYTALVMQSHIKVAQDRSEIKENLDRIIQMIDFGVGYFWEVPVRLVVLPEYALQGVTTPGKGEDGLDDVMKKAVEATVKKQKDSGIDIVSDGVGMYADVFALDGTDTYFSASAHCSHYDSEC